MPLLYYIRHGETDWNAEGRLQGQRDIPINERGRAQARCCGEILRDLLARDAVDPAGVDFVASPLGRARETMELMRSELGLAAGGYRLDARLREVGFGQWEGSTFAEVSARWPEAAAARERDKWDFTPPQGESYATMSQRLREWYATLARDTVAVAHGGTLRGLIVQLGIAEEAQAPFLEIGQGVVYAIRQDLRNGSTMTRYA
jgi:broad specificity phosphatase PhoE